jgi:site-specific recombinase XerD
VVGDRPLRQARPHPGHPASRRRARGRRRLGQGPPASETDHLLVSLTRAGRPPRPLTNRDVGRIVARHAERAGLPADRRSPHILRHTFCTHLADAGASVEEIRELAGHADIRTTTIYTAVNAQRLEQRVAAARGRRSGLARLTG